VAFFEGLTHTQIADGCTEPLGTVESSISSGMGKTDGNPWRRIDMMSANHDLARRAPAGVRLGALDGEDLPRSGVHLQECPILSGIASPGGDGKKPRRWRFRHPVRALADHSRRMFGEDRAPAPGQRGAPAAESVSRREASRSLGLVGRRRGASPSPVWAGESCDGLRRHIRAAAVPSNAAVSARLDQASNGASMRRAASLAPPRLASADLTTPDLRSCCSSPACGRAAAFGHVRKSEEHRALFGHYMLPQAAAGRPSSSGSSPSASRSLGPALSTSMRRVSQLVVRRRRARRNTYMDWAVSHLEPTAASLSRTRRVHGLEGLFDSAIRPDMLSTAEVCDGEKAHHVTARLVELGLREA
jgi:hypothetical protein